MANTRKPMSEAHDKATDIIAAALVIMAGGLAVGIILALAGWAADLRPVRLGCLGFALGALAVTVRMLQVKKP